MSRLSRELRFRDLSLIEIQSSLVGSFASLALALAGFGVWSLIWGWLLGRATRLIAAWARAPVSLLGPISLRGSAGLLRFGAWSAVDRLLFTAYTTADSVVIGRLFGPIPLGIYTTSLNLSRMALRKLAPLFNSVGFPVLSSVADERERFVRYELGLSRAISLIGIPVFVGVAVTAADIVPLLLTEKWIETVLPIQVLAPIAGVQLLTTRLANAISAKGRPAWNARVTAAMVILLPGAFWVVASRGYGIAGILGVLALAYPLLLIVRLLMLRRLTGMRLSAYGAALAPALVSSLAMAAAVLGIRVSLVEAGMAPRLAICVVAGAALYALLLFALFRPVVDDAIQRLRELRS